MVSERINRGLLGISVLLTSLIAVLLMGGIRTNPAEVKESVVANARIVEADLRKIEAKVNSINEKLIGLEIKIEQRSHLMSRIIDQLPEVAKDRIYRQEVEQWVKETKKLNPKMNIPPVPKLIKAVTNPPKLEISTKEE